MHARIEEDKKFKEAIGAFIIAFSELEFGLTELCSMTEFDLRKKNQYVAKFMGFSFDQKRKLITSFIKEHLSELEKDWSEINEKIGAINRERRFLAHGFVTYYLPNDNISTYIKEGGKIKEKKQSAADIKKLTQQLYHINTGKNGINGEFHTLFTKTRVNHWNSFVLDDLKIVYKNSGVILSDWKGKDESE